VLEAIRTWRLFPTQIESGLAMYSPRRIAEWLKPDFTLSSRELLVLLDELPDTSKFKEKLERGRRLVEYIGYDPSIEQGSLILMPAHGRLPQDVRVVEEYVDWTLDRKLAARNVRELIAARSYAEGFKADFTHLEEPLRELLNAREHNKRSGLLAKAREHARRGLYAHERG